MRHTVHATDGMETLELDDKEALLVGMKLIELFVEATGLLQFVTIVQGRNRPPVRFRSTSRLKSASSPAASC